MRSAVMLFVVVVIVALMGMQTAMASQWKWNMPVSDVYLNDDGTVSIWTGEAYYDMGPNHSNNKKVYATALAAVLTNRPVHLYFDADTTNGGCPEECQHHALQGIAVPHP